MANRYWVGGDGTWDATTTHWSASSGGASGASAPTLTDDVFFDNLSGSNYTVTIGSGKQCQNLTVTAPNVGTVTFAVGTVVLEVYGDVVYGVGFNTACTLNLTFRKASGTQTFTTSGISITGNMRFGNDGGTTKLLDDLNFNRSNGIIQNGSGVFDPNGKTVYINSGAFGSTQGVGIDGVITFYNLVVTGPTAINRNCLALGSLANITVTNNLSFFGTTNRLLVHTGTQTTFTSGSQKTITCNGTVFAQYTDFLDINGSGSANWDLSNIVGGAGDGGGNSGITFTPAQTNYFYTSTTGSKDVNDSSYWFLGTKGTGGVGRFPLPQDTGIFDANSCPVAGISLHINCIDVGTLNFENVINNPTWVQDSSSGNCFGSILLSPNMTTTTISLALRGRGSQIIKSNGKAFRNVLTIDCYGGTYSLSDNFTNTATTGLSIQSGTFVSNGYNINIQALNLSSSITRTINIINSIITFTGTQTTIVTMNTTTGATIIATGSKLVVNNTADTQINFGGAGFQLGDLEVNCPAGVTIQVGTSVKFATVTFRPGQIVKMPGASNIRFNTLNATGTPGNLISFISTSTAIYTFQKIGGGIVNCDYLNIQHCVATPSTLTWYAGKNSVNNQGVADAGSGWIFSSAPQQNFIPFLN